MGKKIILKTLLEAVQAVVPVSLIILILGLILKIGWRWILWFLVGDAFLILGLALFTIGSVGSTITIAESIGGFIVKKRRLSLFIGIAFLVGFLIAIADPSVWVLADQFKTLITPSNMALAVAIGMGILVMIALVRILIRFRLQKLFALAYLMLFLVAAVIDWFRPGFLPSAFDAGGFATGPMAVPFILALGLGIARARGDKSSEEDSFGLIGIASVGPILAVLILGLFLEPVAPVTDLTTTMGEYFLIELRQMALAILPFILFFVVFQIIAFRFSKKRVIQIAISFLYTYLGLVFFLTGANGGLVNIGYALGEALGSSSVPGLLIPIGMIFGFSVVAVEPAVIAINRQVEEVTAGAISRKFMMIAFSIGVAAAVGISFLRILTGISLWWFLLPGYALAVFLSFKTPSMFSSIAFDAGGAVSGTMTTAFLVPLALGAATAFGADILQDAFGLVALVALAPLITIPVLGILSQKRQPAVPAIPGVEDEFITIPETEVKS